MTPDAETNQPAQALLLASYNIVFREIPGEVTLALNISGCPHRCPGCHSPHLWEDTGEPLDGELLDSLLARYADSVTCVCFMGGDSCPAKVERLSLRVRGQSACRLRTGWYSGRERFPDGCSWDSFDYVKLGPYVQSLGGLDSEATNQRFYTVTGGRAVDITRLFRKNGPRRR